jgi:hypothetical protein
MEWIVLLVRLAAEPSRHRVAVWRELRRAGAVSLGPGVWAVPAAPVFQPAIQRAGELARRGNGELLALDARPRDPTTAAELQAAFEQARQAEWAEFLSECDRFEAEIAKELRKGKLIVAELEEEEHSLERLRRWYRELKTRDVLGAGRLRRAGLPRRPRPTRPARGARRCVTGWSASASASG